MLLIFFFSGDRDDAGEGGPVWADRDYTYDEVTGLFKTGTCIL